MAEKQTVDQKTETMKTGADTAPNLKVTVETQATEKPEPAKSVYSKPVIAALKAAHRHPERMLANDVDGETREAISGLGILGADGALNTKGSNVVTALAAAKWRA